MACPQRVISRHEVDLFPHPRIRRSGWIKELTMEVFSDTASNLATDVADVRRTPLVRLAQEAGSDEGLRRVLPGAAADRVAAVTFNSSI